MRPNKCAGQPADAALQSDAVLALFVDLERQIDRAVFFVEVAVGGVGIVRLELFEIAELVQAQQTEFPEARVIDLAFFEHDFAPDDLVARGGVALELDAPHIKLLAFVNVDQ